MFGMLYFMISYTMHSHVEVIAFYQGPHEILREWKFSLSRYKGKCVLSMSKSDIKWCHLVLSWMEKDNR